ncbi:MAG: hypothetical protein A3F10_02775 [Coxiella sp. RIFCSPHIGHO2_12_FULL_42_15]|nr:MAG: hypothetical protein A3F10_02775 [Coxiella sp. RIFCSPHIGHO2_12_FULL_42_15]
MQTRQPTSLDPCSIEKVLRQERGLQPLCKKAEQIQCANHILAHLLSPPLQQHCQVANYENTTLTVRTNSAVWATQLRYQQRVILDALQQHPFFKLITDLKIRIYLPETSPPPRQRRTLQMTRSTSELIKNSADAVTHPDLKAALQRLSNNKKSS